MNRNNPVTPKRLARVGGWLSLLFAAALLGWPRRTATLLGLQQSRAVLYGLGIRDLVLAWGLLGQRRLAWWQTLRAASDAVDTLLLIVSAGRDPALRVRSISSTLLAALFSLLGWWNAWRLTRRVKGNAGGKLEL